MTVGWRELRSAAVRATGRGWPVVPGTYLGSDRRWHDRQDATRLCPLSDTWSETPVTDPDQAHEIWSDQPYGVLLVCVLNGISACLTNGDEQISDHTRRRANYQQPPAHFKADSLQRLRLCRHREV